MAVSTVPRQRRLYSGAYDSVQQRGLPTTGDSARDESLGRAALLGRLRLDVILSGAVLLTDAMVLDGPLFARVPPSAVEDALPTDVWGGGSVAVRLRAPSAEQALVQMFTDSAGGLKAFEASVLGPESRERCSAHLRSRVAAGDPAPRDLGEVVELVRRSGVPDDELAAVVRHWTRWIEHLDGGGCRGVVAEPFEMTRLELAAAVKLNEAEVGGWADYVGDALPESLVSELDGALAANRPRSELYALVRDGVQDPGERRLALEYVDRIHTIAFSRQHGAEDFAVGQTTVRPSQLGLQPVHGRPDEMMRARDLERLAELGLTDVELPSDFLVRVALLSTDALEQWALACGPALVAWREEQDGGRPLKHAVRRLEELLAQRVRPDDVRYRLLGQVPSSEPWNRWTRTGSMVKRYGAAPASVGLDAAASASGVDVLKYAVALTLGPARAMFRAVTGNPAIVTSDIALPRRAGPGGGPRA